MCNYLTSFMQQILTLFIWYIKGSLIQNSSQGMHTIPLLFIYKRNPTSRFSAAVYPTRTTRSHEAAIQCSKTLKYPWHPCGSHFDWQMLSAHTNDVLISRIDWASWCLRQSKLLLLSLVLLPVYLCLTAPFVFFRNICLIKIGII